MQIILPEEILKKEDILMKGYAYDYHIRVDKIKEYIDKTKKQCINLGLLKEGIGSEMKKDSYVYSYDYGLLHKKDAIHMLRYYDKHIYLLSDKMYDIMVDIYDVSYIGHNLIFDIIYKQTINLYRKDKSNLYYKNILRDFNNFFQISKNKINTDIKKGMRLNKEVLELNNALINMKIRMSDELLRDKQSSKNKVNKSSKNKTNKSSKNKANKSTRNTLVLYTDGSFSPETQKAGIGVYAREHTGREIEISKRIYHTDWNVNKTDVNSGYAELYAITHAIKVAIKKGYSTINVKTDYLAAVNQFKNRDYSKRPKKGKSNILMHMFNLEMHKIYKSKNNDINITLEHVKGHARIQENEIADSLAAVSLTK